MFGREYLLILEVRRNTEGVVGVHRWFDSLEEVQQIIQKAKEQNNLVTYSIVTDDEYRN